MIRSSNQKIRPSHLVMLIGISLIFSGCASMLNKGNRSVQLESEPSGATVHVNGNQKGTTPFTYEYSPDDGKEVVFELRHTGYEPATVTFRARSANGVLFADAMLLGIPFIVDHNSPDLYSMPVDRYHFQLYKEINEDLRALSVPITGVDLALGENPDLGTFARKPIKLKDGIFRELNYGDPLNSAFIMGLKNSWIETRSVRAGTTKGDEALRRSKMYLRPKIVAIEADLTGKENDASGKVRMAVEWNFMSSVVKDSLLFSERTDMTTMISGARSSEILSDVVRHSARRLLENEELHARIEKAYGEGLKLSKGDVVQLTKPGPIAFDGRKEMISALVKAVVTIQTEDGHGSGFLITNDGHMITNAHVVKGERKVKVKFEQGFTLDGEVIKTNEDYDLALVKVEASDLPALTIGDDKALLLGEELFAIGTPLDQALGQSVSRGILSGHRDLEGFRFLQTDVSINPGNSGGPLIDENGHVVGVATLKISGQGLEGLGFGVPISSALEMLNISLR